MITRVLSEAELNCQLHPDSIIHDIRNALDSANHYQLKPEINLLLEQLGNCYFYSAHYSLALHHYNQLLENQRDDRDDLGRCRTYNRIARTYGYSGDNEKAMQSYYDAIKLAERIPDRREYATAINGLGISYYILGDLNRARELCTQALTIFSELADDYGKANAMEHLGIIAYRINDYDQALNNYQTALDIKTNHYPHYLLEIGELMDELTAVYIKQKQFTKALKLLNRLLNYRQRTHSTNREANLYFRIANLHIEMEQIDQAMPYLNQAYQMYRQNGNLRALYNVSLKLYQIYKNHYHDPQQTIRYLEEYSNLKDSITNTENRSRVSDMAIKHETEKSRIQIEKQRYFNRFLILTILLVSLSLIILGYQFRKNKNLNRELTHKNLQIMEQKNLLQETNQHLLLQQQEISKQAKNMEYMNQKLNRLNEKLIIKYNEIYQEAIMDKLTRIYNRAYVMDVLGREAAKSQRYQSNLCCLLYDIDHFKLVNDHYGHLIGDEVLKQSTQRVKDHIRNGDVFGRWGGEEFIIVLPNLDLNEAFQVGEKVRQSIEVLQYDLDETQLSITISIGIASILSTSSYDPQRLVHHADQALYQAKNSGRNQTRIFQSV